MSIIYQALRKSARETNEVPEMAMFSDRPGTPMSSLSTKTLYRFFLLSLVLALGAFYIFLQGDLPAFWKTQEKNLIVSTEKASESTNASVTEGMTKALPLTEWEELFSQAILLEDKGAVEKAMELYLDITRIRPDYVPAYMNLGRLYFQKGHYEQATETYTRAINLSPYNPRAYNNRGTTYLKRGWLHLALLDYQKALEEDPDYAMAYYNLSSLYAKAGEYEDHDLAMAYLEKAINYDPQIKNWAKTDPDFSRIRNKSRFIELLESVRQPG